jgi:hypothetical protein
MKFKLSGLMVAVILVCTLMCGIRGQRAQTNNDTNAHRRPQVFLLEAKDLEVSRRALHENDKNIAPAWA